MRIIGLVLLVSMTSASAFFFRSLYCVLDGQIRWTKFMALGLLSSAVSCATILFYGINNDLIIAALIFTGLSALFYWAYLLTKK